MTSPARLRPFSCVAALVALFAVALLFPSGARAAEESRKNFDVPSGEAVTTLKRFSAQAGRQVIFPEAAVAGETTRAVSGTLAPSDALARMLAGTRLTFVRDEQSGAFAIRTDASSAKKDPARAEPSPAARAANAPGQPGADEPVALSPFEVRGVATGGYLAAESATGTRYAAPNREIPFPVNVITGEFIENFLAFDFSDVVAYTSNFTPTEGTGAFNLRGVRNFSHYKNGIREGGVYGPVSVERVEVIKGANASIYGATEPTGLRNIVTKRAGPTRASSLRFNFGTDDFSRVALDVNQPIVADKLLTRFAASTEHSEQFVQDFARFRRVTAYNSTTWRLAPATALTVNSEYIKFRSHAQNSGVLPFVLTPVTVNGVATTAFTGILGGPGYRSIQHYNFAGPHGYNQVEYTQIDGTLAHKFNDVFSARFLGNHWIRAQNIVRTNAVATGANANTYNSATGVIPGTFSPRLERNHQWQDNAQIDLLAQFRTGPVEHKLLVTGDYLITDTDAR